VVCNNIKNLKTNNIMKQTAVEWLFQNIWTNPPENLLEIIDKAKEMEKEQQGYSEEEVIEILLTFRAENPRYIEEFIEQFKKK